MQDLEVEIQNYNKKYKCSSCGEGTVPCCDEGYIMRRIMMILFNQEVVGDMKGELLELMQVAKNVHCISTRYYPVTHEPKKQLFLFGHFKIKDDLYIFTIF